MIGERTKEGYLLIDNRNAPGPTLEQIRASGFKGFVAGAGERGVFESATKTCCHCNAVVVLNPDRTRPRGYCRKCDAYVCDNPGCSTECVPFMRKLDVGEARARQGLILPTSFNPTTASI